MSRPYDYFKQSWAYALTASEQCGVLPEIIWAQSANETLYGLHAPQNNYFGIKGAGHDYTTIEWVKGKPIAIPQHFAGYASMADSFAGYAAFIRENERYSAFRRGPNIVAQLGALSRSGYATDPDYTQKVARIAAMVPALLKRYNGIVAKVGRALSPMPVPVIVHSPVAVVAPAIQETEPMSDLSVAEKDVGSWISQHASALTGAANVLKTILGAVPVPAAQAVSGVISGLEGLATQAQTVAANVTTTVAAIAAPPTLAAIENTVETEAFQAALAAAEISFTELLAGKPIATIGADALKAAETAAETVVQRGSSN